MEDEIRDYYADPVEPGSYQGPQKLLQSIREQYPDIDIQLSDVKKALEKENAYTLNRKVIKRFPRNQVVVSGIDNLHDADLADMALLHKWNDKYSYFLLVIDVFSRYTWVRPLIRKGATEVTDAFASIYAEGRIPDNLRTDGGAEFTNDTLKRFMRRHRVNLFHTNNDKKACYAERCIRTIKEKLYRYLITNNTRRYIDVLQDIVKSYNHTVHRSLGIAPADVTEENEDENRWQQFKRRDKPKSDYHNPFQKYKFELGDHVRIVYEPEKFDRAYSQFWSGEIFVIANRKRRRTIPVYNIHDILGEDIKGTFYTQELQKVNYDPDEQFKIEKYVDDRIDENTGRRQVKVRWLDWPRKFDTWEYLSEIEDDPENVVIERE